MNPLLDTVEPDAFWVNGWLMLPRQAEKYQGKDPLYSRPKMEAHIESLLSQCRREARKEAFLELADDYERRQKPHVEGATQQTIPVAHLIDELRRRAEGEK